MVAPHTLSHYYCERSRPSAVSHHCMLWHSYVTYWLVSADASLQVREHGRTSRTSLFHVAHALIQSTTNGVSNETPQASRRHGDTDKRGKKNNW